MITDEQIRALQCTYCPNPATCVGRYDLPEEDLDEPGCDECCGHGCEDGYCEHLYDEDGDVTDEGRKRASKLIAARRIA